MKKLLVVLVLAGLAFSASAQKYRRGGYHVVRPRVIVGFGYSPFYSPYYNPYGGYPYGYGYAGRPSRLELEIEDIRIDYADRIHSVKMDKDITRRERRQRIRQLKTDRDREIVQAQRDYYYHRSNRGRS